MFHIYTVFFAFVPNSAPKATYLKAIQHAQCPHNLHCKVRYTLLPSEGRIPGPGYPAARRVK